MISFFTHLTAEQTSLLLPKAQVALLLYRHHNALLASKEVRAQIATLDADIGELLHLIYEKKRITRQELTRWIKVQEQGQQKIAVQITTPQRYLSSSGIKSDEQTVTEYKEIGLFAVGKNKIYKRTLLQDIKKIL